MKLASYISTPLTPILLAGTLAIGSGYSCHQSEARRASATLIPFSELSQTKNKAAKAGTSLPPQQTLSAVVNDIAAKIFEAHHDVANSQNIEVERTDFAYNLRRAWTSTNYHHNLDSLFNEFPRVLREAEKDLEPVRTLQLRAAEIVENSTGAWQYDSQNFTREDCGFELNMDGDFEWDCDTVYDHSTHTFTFNSYPARKASEASKALVNSVKPIQRETAILPDSVGDANKEIIRRIQKFNGGKDSVTSEEMFTAAINFSRGSLYDSSIDRIAELWNTIRNEDIPAYNRELPNMVSLSDTTRSKNHEGPVGYRTAKTLASHATQLQTESYKLIKSLGTTRQQFDSLNKLVQAVLSEESAIETDGKPSAEELHRETMKMTRAFYNNNFPGGIEVAEYSGAKVFFAALGGWILGGLVGMSLVEIVTKKQNS